MPRFDGTGPFGTGPVGRRLGPCGQRQSGNYSFLNIGWFRRFKGFGRGLGRRGTGRGWGFMRWFGGNSYNTSSDLSKNK